MAQTQQHNETKHRSAPVFHKSILKIKNLANLRNPMNVQAIMILDQNLKEIALSPDQIMENILAVDEKTYTDEHFVTIANSMPSAEHLKSYSNIPVNSLVNVEKLMVLLSQVSRLKLKVELMKIIKDIRINFLPLKRTIFYSLEAVQAARENKDYNLMVSMFEAVALSIPNYKRFHFKQMVNIRTSDGSKFIDPIVYDILLHHRSQVTSFKNLKYAEKCVNVPAVPEIIHKLKQMKKQLEFMKNAANSIAKVPTHPDDQFNKIIRHFITEKSNDVNILLKSAKELDKNFDDLCKWFVLPPKSITIGEFFEYAIALRDAFKESMRYLVRRHNIFGYKKD